MKYCLSPRKFPESEAIIHRKSQVESDYWHCIISKGEFNAIFSIAPIGGVILEELILCMSLSGDFTVYSLGSMSYANCRGSESWEIHFVKKGNTGTGNFQHITFRNYIMIMPSTWSFSLFPLFMIYPDCGHISLHKSPLYFCLFQKNICSLWKLMGASHIRSLLALSSECLII